jgi:competence protein ComGC
LRGLVAGPSTGSDARAGARSLRRGFTLIDILVTLAVVVVLISLMLPSLGRVRETAHQVVCRSNVRQVGIGVSLYAQDNFDRLMHTENVTADDGSAKPWDTIMLRLNAVGGGPGPWDGLGLLYAHDYLPAPKLYYCPSHSGRHGFIDYSEQWGARSHASISGNYQFRARGPVSRAVANGPQPRKSQFLGEIFPGAAIVADSMRTQVDFNHRIGTNVLRADNSVDWYGDGSGRIVSQLPRQDENPEASQFESAWNNLDEGGR